ncbi:hypothetical protein ILUMI_14547 [Ignelater luminosus]|uniref:PiggyBac transposable element-derived protein domain-containing protein n=1 Tax=Ignelater luminosus TaxID=2038154 RepID=A0A8K0CUP9_IGNLU|nr:hypothetical protein ILUMI_14547 [Ignelater luminosus]
MMRKREIEDYIRETEYHLSNTCRTKTHRIWIRAVREGYVCNFDIYMRKIDGNVDHGLGQTNSKEKDIIYISIITLPVQSDLTGKNLQNLKNDKKLQRGEFDWAVRNNGIACVNRKDKRAVQLLSVINSCTETNTADRRERDSSVTQVPCPAIVKNYRANMGCVDKSNMLKSIDRKHRKWWQSFHFLDVTVVNSHILYPMKSNDKESPDWTAGLIDSNQLKGKPSVPKCELNQMVKLNDWLFIWTHNCNLKGAMLLSINSLMPMGSDIVPNRIVITPPEDVGDNKDCDSADEETNNPDNLNHNQPAAQGNNGFGATDIVRENRMDACTLKKLAKMKRLRRGEMDSVVATHNNKYCRRSLEAQQYCNNIV